MGYNFSLTVRRVIFCVSIIPVSANVYFILKKIDVLSPCCGYPTDALICLNTLPDQPCKICSISTWKYWFLRETRYKDIDLFLKQATDLLLGISRQSLHWYWLLLVSLIWFSYNGCQFFYRNLKHSGAYFYFTERIWKRFVPSFKERGPVKDFKYCL